MDYFFDKTCNITDITSTYIDGESIQSTTAVYTGIPCDFYEAKGKYNKDGFVVEGSHTSYTLVLQGNKTAVKRGQIVEVIDGVSIGKFIIDTYLINRNINGIVDNIECRLSEKRK